MADNSNAIPNKIKRRVCAVIRNESEAKIFRHIDKKTDRANCLFTGTIKGAGQAVHTSYSKARSAFKNLKSHGLVAKERRGLYRVNPALFVVLVSDL
jgi:hypothetical protein